MTAILMLFAIITLWSIARTLKRIERRIATFKVTIDVPIYGDDGGGQPVEKPHESGKVVAFRKR
jgi:hypothetical protein